MKKPDNNVFPHPTLNRKPGGQTRAGYQQRREELAECLELRANHIRGFVSTYKGRLPHELRLQLATQLGKMLYGQPRKRAFLTEILVEAGISDWEDYTKRLPRFAIMPGKQVPSPKDLASKPNPYVRIAEVYAERIGVRQEEAIVDLFSGTSVVDEFKSEDAVELEPYMPIYRMLEALAEAASSAGEAEDYFRELTRWRWITAVDATRRGQDISSFGIWGLTIQEDSSSIPAASLIWLPDRNTFESDPDDPDFFQQRLRLLPKIALYKEKERIQLELNVADSCEKYWDRGGTMPTVELLSATVEFRPTVWLLLCPGGPQGDVRPKLGRFSEQTVRGSCLVDGNYFEFSHSEAPESAALKGEPNRLYLRVGFCPIEGYHVTASAEYNMESAKAAALEPDPYSSLSTAEPLESLSPLSIARWLGQWMDLDGDEHVDISPFTAAPFRTWASYVESNMRFDTDMAMLNDFVSSITSLTKKMDAEVEYLRQESRLDQENIIHRLRKVNKTTMEHRNDD